jgi:hypothetical protein
VRVLWPSQPNEPLLKAALAFIKRFVLEGFEGDLHLANPATARIALDQVPEREAVMELEEFCLP